VSENDGRDPVEAVRAHLVQLSSCLAGTQTADTR
jgi:hypothetical protein